MRNLLKSLRQYLWVTVTIVVFIVVAAAVAGYILNNQRFRWPWKQYTKIEVEFQSGQSVTPGQGQLVLISGVKVGEIGKVELNEGRALVRLDLEETKSGPIYQNATFLLRPRTALNDMSVQVDPGSSRSGRLRDGDRVGLAATQVNVNPDELLSALDADTRDYFRIVAGVMANGTKNQGAKIRAVLKAGQPTAARLARITRSLADRRHKLRRLVTNMRRLARATAAKDEELASLVDASSATFRALGERERELTASVERLPGALRATRRALRDGRRLAQEAAPALTALRPAARELAPALVAARPLLREATPILRRRLNPLVRETTPLLRELRPPLRHLNRASPGLIRASRVLRYLANELGHNPPGPEEGYLFWTAWFAHTTNSIFSIEDAHGAAWRGLVTGSCSSFRALGELALPPSLLDDLHDAVPICE